MRCCHTRIEQLDVNCYIFRLGSGDESDAQNLSLPTGVTEKDVDLFKRAQEKAQQVLNHVRFATFKLDFQSLHIHSINS